MSMSDIAGISDSGFRNARPAQQGPRHNLPPCLWTFQRSTLIIQRPLLSKVMTVSFDTTTEERNYQTNYVQLPGSELHACLGQVQSCMHAVISCSSIHAC